MNLTPVPMLVKITLLIFGLVALNFLLLKFSSNKTIKPVKGNKAPVVLKPQITILEEPQILAPTGS